MSLFSSSGIIIAFAGFLDSLLGRILIGVFDCCLSAFSFLSHFL